MVNANKNWVSMTDDAIITHLGQFLKDRRIAKNITQEQLAQDVGLNRYTIGRIENGESVTLQVFIQILRGLDLLYVLDSFSMSDAISPLEAVKLSKKKRERASGSAFTKPSEERKSDW